MISAEIVWNMLHRNKFVKFIVRHAGRSLKHHRIDQRHGQKCAQVQLFVWVLLHRQRQVINEMWQLASPQRQLNGYVIIIFVDNLHGLHIVPFEDGVNVCGRDNRIATQSNGVAPQIGRQIGESGVVPIERHIQLPWRRPKCAACAGAIVECH